MNKRCWAVVYTLNPTLGRQQQGYFCEFQDSQGCYVEKSSFGGNKQTNKQQQKQHQLQECEACGCALGFIPSGACQVQACLFLDPQVLALVDTVPSSVMSCAQHGRCGGCGADPVHSHFGERKSDLKTKIIEMMPEFQKSVFKSRTLQ